MQVYKALIVLRSWINWKSSPLKGTCCHLRLTIAARRDSLCSQRLWLFAPLSLLAYLVKLHTHTHTHTHTHRSKQSHVYYDCNCLLVWKDVCLPWCEVLEQEMNANLFHVLPCLPLVNKLQTVSRLGPIPSGCPAAIKWLGIVHAISEWFVFLQ